MTHPMLSYARILEYAARELDPKGAALVRRALAFDPARARTVRLYWRIQKLRGTDDLCSPSPAALRRAKEIYSLPRALGPAGA